jgi:hypothetical protein
MGGVKITRAHAGLRTFSALAENVLPRSSMTAFCSIPSFFSVHARWGPSGRQNVPGGRVHIDKDVEAVEKDGVDGVDGEEVGHRQRLL